MNKRTLVFFSLIATLTLASCSHRQYEATSAYTGTDLVYADQAEAAMIWGSDEMSGKADKERVFGGVSTGMMIYNASMSIRVKSADQTNAELKVIAEKYEGYVLNSGTSYSTIRVKAEKLDAAMGDIALLGKLKSKNITGQDVTAQYTDMAIRLENAMKARERYLELLANAENVQSALLVEKELERLNGEIELYKGQMKQLEHLTAYSTINVSIDQKEKLGPLGYVFVGLWKGVSWLFVRS